MKRHSQRPSRDLSIQACHEAGHGAAAYLLRTPCPELALSPDRAGSSNFPCSHSKLSPFRPALEPVALPAPQATLRDLQWRDYIERQLAAALAGGCAVGILWGKAGPTLGEGDRRRVDQLLEYAAAPNSRERAAYLAWLTERTRALLAEPRHWAAVGALARRLLEQGRLTEPAVRKAVRGALQASPASGSAQERLAA